MDTPKLQTRALNLDLDSPEFSICPRCEAQVIKLADGCGICGWSEEDKLLGGINKCSFQKSDTSITPIEEKVINTSDKW